MDILVANMDLIYWLVLSSSKMRREGGIVILASCEYNFIRVHKNLVHHPSNNKWILAIIKV